jgi:hypothetical protein
MLLSSTSHPRAAGYAAVPAAKREEPVMHRMIVAAVAAIAVAAVAASAAALVLVGPAAGAASCPRPSKLPAEFVGRVDNPYFPLTPGTTLNYRGKLDGRPATDVFAVTNRTKVILGVTTTVVHDQVFVKGELVEDTEDWFAQDGTGKTPGQESSCRR